MTPRRLIGLQQRRGGSHRESSLLPIGSLGVIYDSQVANRITTEEGGLSQGVLPASYWSPGSHI
jgi:hypothetical protein